MLNFTWLMYAVFMAVGIFGIDFLEKKVAGASNWSWSIGLFLLVFDRMPGWMRALGLGCLFGSDQVANQFIKLESQALA